MYSITRRNLLKATIVLGGGVSMGLAGCGSDSGDQTTARFAVLSDPHVYDKSLGTTGTAFETYLSNDRKMLVQSSEILEQMVDELLKVKGLNFVLVPGDMTKDGEKVCHNLAASILKPLLNAGIAVYVVPGNHDINNPHAVAFSGDTTTPVEQVTASEFATIYKNYGYGSAIYRDPNSLSYVAKVADKTWLFAIDTSKYNNNTTDPDTSGAISGATLTWIREKLAEAKSKHYTVFGMCHHGVTPHFAAQTTFFPEYVLDDYLTVGEAMADAGLNLMFTGHFHAQDMVETTFSDSSLYDIETGSGVTAPCPYRVIDLDIRQKKFDINSYTIDSIPSMTDFVTFKNDFVNNGMLELYQNLLPSYGIPVTVAPAAAEIHVAHYKGDEPGYTSMSATTQAIMQSLLTSTDPTTLNLGLALADFSKDNSITDNAAEISL